MSKRASMLLVLFIGLSLSLIIFFKEKYESPLLENAYLERNEMGKGDYKIKLKGAVGDSYGEYSLTVSERDYSSAELSELCEALKARLPSIISEGYPSENEISGDISFKSLIEGFPFYLKWNSEDESIIDSAGKLKCPYDCNKTHNLVLDVGISYGSFRDSYSFSIKVVPKNLEENSTLSGVLSKLLDEADKSNPEKSYLKLPDSLGGERISWSTGLSRNSIYVAILAFALSIGVGIAWEYDNKRKEQEKEREMLKFYPGFVERIRLYVLSGMTIRNVLFKICDSYKRSNVKNPLSEQLFKACNRLKNGNNEEKVYEELGECCGEHYRKLMFILTVNLNQGNEKLLKVLKEESERAISAQRENVKRVSEEAGVKLLFPMVLILMMVMAVILLPAYMDFGK